MQATDSYLQDYSIPTVQAAKRDRASVQVDPVSLEGKQRIDAIRAGFDRFTGAEQDLATVRQEQTDAATRRAITAATAGLAVSVLLIVLYTGYLTTAMVRPLRLAAALAGRLAGGDFGARLPERGVGEIGALERSLNTMADSLERGRAELDSPGRGSSPPATGPGGRSSGTCTTGPSSGWSHCCWSCARPRRRCRRTSPSCGRSWPGSRTS